MLKIQNIRKEYKTGSLIQRALDDVSLSLRDNEFVAILGPSGSGKTTLLNIIGGLDRYDSGDLIINGVSTKKYKDRDWDSYRNHTIGFVFQSYNLIPHQTVADNVELALTISGIGRKERKERALLALKEVGLYEHAHKRPNQLSGGQMQRVAIARALVNDPQIVLADEPTGALDSDTSLQVMDLLKEVAKDRLVVMVTHNPELATDYANRIVTLKDGKIISDSNPYEEKERQTEAIHKNLGKASMSFLTALSLSFHNLTTKKARTLLTAFAGSIGIIGIALILALSTGVNRYIQKVEEDTLSEYPLQIQSTGFDMTSMMMGANTEKSDKKETGEESDKVKVVKTVTNMFTTMNANDLKSLKAYFDSDKSKIKDYTNAISYTYLLSPQIYRVDKDDYRQVNPDQSFTSLGFGSANTGNSIMSRIMSTDVFFEMPQSPKLYQEQYEIKAGHWPKKHDELVLVLTSSGKMSDLLAYALGLRDDEELDTMVEQFLKEETVTIGEDIEKTDYSYPEILGREFKLVRSADYYQYDPDYQVWRDKHENKDYMQGLVEKGEKLKIVGIVKPKEDAKAAALSLGIGYPATLTEHVVEEAKKSEIVAKQLESPDVNVFTKQAFGENTKKNFDNKELFSIDSGALKDAFAFDGDKISDLGSGMDLSTIDFSSAFAGEDFDLSSLVDVSKLDLTGMDLSSLDVESLLKTMSINLSQEGLIRLGESLQEGYKTYASQHPQADYSHISDDMISYLNSSEGKEILKVFVEDKLLSQIQVEISVEEARELFREFLKGYLVFVEANHYTDPNQIDQYIEEYLQTEEAKAFMGSLKEDLISNVKLESLTREQIEELALALANGYISYAEKNNLPDIRKMGEHFITYFNSPDGQTRFFAGMEQVIDKEEVNGQFEKVIKELMGQLGTANADSFKGQMTSLMGQISGQMTQAIGQGMQEAMAGLGDSLKLALADGMKFDEEAFKKAFQMNMTEDSLKELMMSMAGEKSASYEENLRLLGYVDFAKPSAINIYPKDFVSKEEVIKILDNYNTKMKEEGQKEKVITYTDVVGALMSSVTDIIDVISYVLIAFVAISLVVSSIMIGVITYISVLERKKEIGILRAMGASKGNVSQVFNAETFIIGFLAGVMGIGLSLLILIPGNMLIHHLANTKEVSATLPILPGLILILLSVLLTLLGGLLPSKKAAKSDPVTALRTE